MDTFTLVRLIYGGLRGRTRGSRLWLWRYGIIMGVVKNSLLCQDKFQDCDTFLQRIASQRRINIKRISREAGTADSVLTWRLCSLELQSWTLDRDLKSYQRGAVVRLGLVWDAAGSFGDGLFLRWEWRIQRSYPTEMKQAIVWGSRLDCIPSARKATSSCETCS
jgi:hypothetical protein